MSKQIVSVSLAAMLAACASVPEVDTQASSSNKLGVVQVGTKQNANYFLRAGECPQRTPSASRRLRRPRLLLRSRCR
jgi:hypothetical protein